MNADQVMEDPPCRGRLGGLALLVRKPGPMVLKPAFRISLYDLHHFYVPLKAL